MSSTRPRPTVFRTARLRSADAQRCIEFYWRENPDVPPVDEVVVHPYTPGSSHDLPPIFTVSPADASVSISSGTFEPLTFETARSVWGVLMEKGWTQVNILHDTNFGKCVLEAQARKREQGLADGRG